MNDKQVRKLVDHIENMIDEKLRLASLHMPDQEEIDTTQVKIAAIKRQIMRDCRDEPSNK